MALRGIGAAKGREAREALAARARPRRLPWKRAGLSRAERVIAFLEWLPITKGIRAGKRMKLLPGQRAFIEDIFATDAKGRRRVQIAVRSEPRGNGKTGLVAGLCLAFLLGPEAEQRGEIYSAAVDREHAGKLWAELAAIVEAVPEFAARVNPEKSDKLLTVLSGDGAGSVYESLTANPKRAHGLAPLLWVYDELAQVQNPELLENLRTGMGKRKESLGIVISTQAEDDNHVLSRLIDDGLKGIDSSVLVHLTTAPLDADPFAEKTLRDCNPAWDVFLDGETLMREAEQARRLPAFEPRYRLLRLNQRVRANPENRLVTLPVWQQGLVPVEREKLRGRRAYAALDLSGKHDLTALVLVVPDDEPDPGYDVLCHFWTPKGQLMARPASERARFMEWIDRGHLTAIDGPVIRYPFVAAEVARLAAEFNLASVAFDPWRIDDFRLELAETGCTVPLEPFGQGFKSMAPAVETFAELALAGRIRHGGHPVLTAAVTNAVTTSDAAGNLKPDKGRGNTLGPVRIDGAVVLLMALAVASRRVEQPAPFDHAGFIADMRRLVA